METCKAPADYEAAVFSPLALYRISSSNRSADQMNYAPMVTASQFGAVVVSLGKIAQMGDFYADAANRAIRKVSPFLNGWQIMAGIADAFAEMHKGWHDTRSATGPEAGRPSSHEHDITETQAILLVAAVSEVGHNLQLGTLPGIGWALRAMIEERKINVYQINMPNVAKSLQS